MSDKRATEGLLAEMHGVLTKALIDKIKAGEATAADLNVARQMLKDNGIQALPDKNSGLKELTDILNEAQVDPMALPQ